MRQSRTRAAKNKLEIQGSRHGPLLDLLVNLCSKMAIPSEDVLPFFSYWKPALHRFTCGYWRVLWKGELQCICGLKCAQNMLSEES